MAGRAPAYDATPLDVLLASVPSLPRAILSRLTARMILCLDELAGDTDLNSKWIVDVASAQWISASLEERSGQTSKSFGGSWPVSQTSVKWAKAIKPASSTASGGKIEKWPRGQIFSILKRFHHLGKIAARLL
jgi:hypothetical protein